MSPLYVTSFLFNLNKHKKERKKARHRDTYPGYNKFKRIWLLCCQNINRHTRFSLEQGRLKKLFIQKIFTDIAEIYLKTFYFLFLKIHKLIFRINMAVFHSFRAIFFSDFRIILRDRENGIIRLGLYFINKTSKYFIIVWHVWRKKRKMRKEW